MQAKKSSAGQMFWINKKRVIQENIFEIGYNKQKHLFSVLRDFLDGL